MKNNISCRQIKHDSYEYWETVRLRYDVLRVPLNLDYTYSALLAEKEDIHLAAYIKDKLAGCLILTLINEREVKMRQVAVSTDLQGQGIGKALVGFSEDWASGNSFVRIVLNARQSAVPFYIHLGYEVVGEPFIEVTIPHRKMRKDIK